MHLLKRLTYSTLFCLLFSACAAQEEDIAEGALFEGSGSSKSDSADCNFDSLFAEEYMDNFRNEEVSDSFVRAAGVMSGHELSLTESHANFTFYFLPNNRVVVEYLEHPIEQPRSNTSNSRMLILDTFWEAYDDGAIGIAGVGQAARTVIFRNDRCAPGLDLSIEEDLLSPGLSGKSTQIVPIYTTADLSDPTNTADWPEWWQEKLQNGEIVIRTVEE